MIPNNIIEEHKILKSTVVVPARKMMLIVVTCFFLTIMTSFASRPKILCLHGGGQSVSSMKGMTRDLVDALPEFEFIFASASSAGSLWIQDPPGGKGQPTTDPSWADTSITILDGIVESQGPFYGILGYSQGAAFVPVYLSKRKQNNGFEIAVTFCGYLTTTHTGLLEGVNDQSPFNIQHLVWMGAKDTIISNDMTIDMSTKFTNPTIVLSTVGAHAPPDTTDPTFDEIVLWIRQKYNNVTSPTITPTITSSGYNSRFLYLTNITIIIIIITSFVLTR